MATTITIFNVERRPVDSIANFLNLYYILNLRFLASDLLKYGLSPSQISEAVNRAINVGKATGLKIDQHFRPVFSSMNTEIIKDCKLSNLAYALVLLNADVDTQVVGSFQVYVLQHYLKGH